MICPSCGSHIPDGSVVCPACRALTGAASAAPADQPTYCAHCGALVPEGLAWCPECGMRVRDDAPGPSRRPVPELDRRLPDPTAPAGDGDGAPLEDTRAMPRLDTAVPAVPDPAAEEPGGRSPRLRSLLLAALVALLLVGGATLLITHPWDPNALDTRATTPRDTSRAGFPGTLDSLSGQDGDEGAAGDDADPTWRTLHDAWVEMGEIGERLTEQREGFDEVAYSGTAVQREQAAAEAEQAAVDLSNLIDEVSSAGSGDGEWSETVGRLVTMGNWLRNYADNLRDAWDVALSYDDPAAHRDEIDAILASQRNADGRNTYEAMFDEAYEGAEPAEPEEP